MKVAEDLATRLDANFSLLTITTPEESRAIQTIARVATQKQRNLFLWSITRGLVMMCDDGTTKAVEPKMTPAGVSAWIAGDRADPSITVLLDFGPYLRDPVVVRGIREALPVARERMGSVVMLGAQLSLPPELAREAAAVDLPLPGADDLAALVEVTLEANGQRKGLVVPTGEALARVVDSMRGLTVDEAENALALAIVRTGQVDTATINTEKARAVKTSGAIEILETPKGGLASIGGLAGVKEWIRTRGQAFAPEAKAYGLPNPKGALLVGVQGCGKSAIAKAAAAALEIPLVRLDVGALFGGLVGESESNVRAALKTLDAIAPCVCMVDEIEKAFAGGVSGKGDSGTSARVLGTFLTWAQEHTSPVFLVATANNVEALPPELLRRGRWDTMLFVDLPSVTERAEILRIHLEARKRIAAHFDLTALAAEAHNFSGAELEQCVIDAMFAAFADGRRPMTTADISTAIAATVPLAVTMDGPITKLREWASSRCVPASGVIAPVKTAARGGRRVA